MATGHPKPLSIIKKTKKMLECKKGNTKIWEININLGNSKIIICPKELIIEIRKISLGTMINLLIKNLGTMINLSIKLNLGIMISLSIKNTIILDREKLNLTKIMSNCKTLISIKKTKGILIIIKAKKILIINLKNLINLGRIKNTHQNKTILDKKIDTKLIEEHNILGRGINKNIKAKLRG